MAYFVYGLFNLLMVVLTSANFLMALDEAVLAWVVDAAIIFFRVCSQIRPFDHLLVVDFEHCEIRVWEFGCRVVRCNHEAVVSQLLCMACVD